MALALSLVVAVAVWVTVSGYLLAQRQQAALNQAAANAAQLRLGLSEEGVSAPQLLAQLPRDSGSTSLLRVGERWFTSSLQTVPGMVPAELRRSVRSGVPSSQRFELGDRPVLAVGTPLDTDSRALYFEIFPLSELDLTLRTLSTALVAALLVVVLGSPVLAWWALRPALRPLDRVASATAAVAAGDLSARLDPDGDPALAAIAASFNDTAAALERRVRADAKFAADVSHELRSPLTTMVTAVELIDTQRETLPAAAREALGLLRAEVDRFRRLVEDLLEISRSDAGSDDLVLDSVVLADLVRRSVPEQHQDRVVVTPRAAGTRVRVDKRRLERALSNLVDNAERHGGGSPR